MHGSSDNITPYPRSNLFIVYNSVQNALVRPHVISKDVISKDMLSDDAFSD